MANAQFPFGFQQFGRQDGSSPTAGLTAYSFHTDNAPIGYGDPVDLTLGAVSVSNPATPVLGIFFGCTYIDASTKKFIWNNFWPGSGASAVDSAGIETPVTAYVCDDPAQLYIAQAGGALNITQAMVGQAIGFAPGVSLDVLGNSTATLANNGSTAFRIVGLYTDFVSPSSVTNGTDNTSPANIAVVAPNNFIRRDVLAAA